MNYCDMLLRQHCDRYCDNVGGVQAEWSEWMAKMIREKPDKPDINPTETRQSDRGDDGGSVQHVLGWKGFAIRLGGGMKR